MSTYSRYRRRISDTVNNGVAWKMPSFICSCQWCIKSEVFCGNCWMVRQRLEAAKGCRQSPQYDGKCSFYLNCYFFCTSPTNQDLREKAVYFPPRGQPNSMREMIDWLNSFALDAYCIVDNTQVEPRWKINSFLSEISVCWSSAEQITIKIERAFSVMLRASPAIRCSFQPSPQHPTGPQQTSDLIHNWQLQMQDGVFHATPLLTVSPIRRLYRLYVDIRLLIEVVTVEVY